MDFEFIRGDTQVIKFQLKDGEGNLVQLGLTDNLYFTVKQNSNSEEVLLQKTYPNDIKYVDEYYIFTITSEDTSSLAYGSSSYDIELKSGDYVKTLGMGSMTVTDEITFRGDE